MKLWYRCVIAETGEKVNLFFTFKEWAKGIVSDELNSGSVDNRKYCTTEFIGITRNKTVEFFNNLVDR